MTGIVVGIERTPEGVAALDWALRAAVARSMPLFAVRAWIDVFSAGFADIPLSTPLSTDSTAAAQQARQLAEELVKEVSENVPAADTVDVRVFAERGGAGRVLVHAASDKALLVVGTRSANALSRALLGSVTEHVLHHAPCPVAVVPAPRPHTGHPGRVVVAVDHSQPSLAALGWAADEAARRGAVLCPVHVREERWPSEPTVGGRPVRLADLEASERRSLREAVPADAQVAVEPEVMAGSPGKALVRFAEPQDLLVVGSRGRKAAVGALLGSTSSYLAEHAPCPVVVVREGQAG